MIQPYPPGAADAGGDFAEQGIGEILLHGFDVRTPQSRVQGPDAAGDVKAHAARGHHAAGLRIERGHAADGKAVAPVRIRHRVRRLDDPRQPGDVCDLFIDLVVHRPDQVRVGVDDRRHVHAAFRLDLPGIIREPVEPGAIHRRETSLNKMTGSSDKTAVLPLYRDRIWCGNPQGSFIHHAAG